jgi:hypothetical protein
LLAEVPAAELPAIFFETMPSKAFPYISGQPSFVYHLPILLLFYFFPANVEDPLFIDHYYHSNEPALIVAVDVSLLAAAIFESACDCNTVIAIS